MEIQQNYFLYINIAIIIIYLVFILIGYLRGLLYEVVSILYSALALYVSWIISPVLANLYPILSLKNIYEDDVVTNLFNFDPILNTIIYFVIVFIVLKIFYIIISLILKGFNKLPIIGKVNKILGAIFGIVNGTIVTLILSMFFTLPIFKNGDEVVEKTIFKFVKSYSNVAIGYIVDNVKIDPNSIELDVDTVRLEFKNWLIK